MFGKRLCCAILLSVFVGQAQAGSDNFDRVVSFGDSLSDNGNLDAALSIPLFGISGFDIAGTFGLLPGSGYFEGRFSDGPTFVELLAGGEGSQKRFFSRGGFFLGTGDPNDGSVNLAVGGATTEGGELFSAFGQDFGIPSVENQIREFQAAGGQFGQNDLITLLAGANDIFDADLDVAAAESAAAAQTRNIRALVDAGAPTLLVANLPNLGATPRFNGIDERFGGNAETRQQGEDATIRFNSILATNIEAIAADPGSSQTNIIQADLQGFLDIAIKNPEDFGLINVTEACSDTRSVCANPEQFLFFDNVHPTAVGHFFLAQFVDALLSTDDQAAATGPLGELTVSSRLEASDILFRQAVQLLWTGEAGGPYAEIIGQLGSGSGSGGGSDFDYQLAGLRVGFDARWNDFIIGAAFAYLEGDINGRLLSSDVGTAQLDAYLLYQFDPFFLGVEGGASFTEFDDVRRDTGIPTLIAESDTDSFSYTLAATLGMNFDVGRIRLTPAFRAGYLSANVDALSENVPLLALAISDREIDAGFWTARIRASTYLDTALRPQLFVEAGYEDLFSIEDGYNAQLIDNTAQIVEATPNAIEARGLFLKAGASTEIGSGAQLSAEYGIAFQESDDEVHSGRISLKIPLGGRRESLK